MLWAAMVAVVACAAAGIVLRRRRRDDERCAAHVRRLRELAGDGSEAGLRRLEAHARECHERGPGRASAEAWFAYGCALLEAGRPERATRAFQLAAHAHAGLNAAVLFAFACLKTRDSDMPRFAEIVGETYAEIRRPPIPEGRWERTLLAAMNGGGVAMQVVKEVGDGRRPPRAFRP